MAFHVDSQHFNRCLLSIAVSWRHTLKPHCLQHFFNWNSAHASNVDVILIKISPWISYMSPDLCK